MRWPTGMLACHCDGERLVLVLTRPHSSSLLAQAHFESYRGLLTVSWPFLPLPSSEVHGLFSSRPADQDD